MYKRNDHLKIDKGVLYLILRRRFVQKTVALCYMETILLLFYLEIMISMINKDV